MGSLPGKPIPQAGPVGGLTRSGKPWGATFITGVHLIATYKAFNHSLVDQAPIAFETLFEPRSNSAAALRPLVAQKAPARDRKGQSGG